MADDQLPVDGLVRLTYTVLQALTEVAADNDLTVQQLRVLGILRDREPTMAELARFMNVEPSSLSGLVDRAQRRGLLRRITATEDRRAFRVQLTEHGRQLGRTQRAAVAERIERLCAGLSAAQRRQLAELTDRLFDDAAD
ncbi:MAG TPA: MarR family transcriptional regulator [Pseudonocardiaceae bacterium]|jgi:DNA-binding MarR family transcriptional regulator|nr:MarR family transcriptional regulator [Pseudonocardiaceae bacterium]